MGPTPSSLTKQSLNQRVTKVFVEQPLALHGSANKHAAQAAGHTIPDAIPPEGKIQPFSKIAVILNPYRDLDALPD